jgi:hypothetical protein
VTAWSQKAASRSQKAHDWSAAAGASKAPIDAAAKCEIRTLILQFEDLMIEELIDWIHISSHDVIEMTP